MGVETGRCIFFQIAVGFVLSRKGKVEEMCSITFRWPWGKQDLSVVLAASRYGKSKLI